MKEPQWNLTMMLTGPTGERVAYTVPMDDYVGKQVFKCSPPDRVLASFGLVSMESTIEILKNRQYRKDLFVEQARRLGALLAERMEDAEGWHDQSRVEPAKRQLSGR